MARTTRDGIPKKLLDEEVNARRTWTELKAQEEKAWTVLEKAQNATKYYMREL